MLEQTEQVELLIQRLQNKGEDENKQFIETLEKENSLYVHSGWGFLLPGRWREAELLSFPFVSSPHNHTASCTKKPVSITPKAKSTQCSFHQKSKACLMWKRFYINTGINLTLLICLPPLPPRISQPNIHQRRNQLKLSVLEWLVADCFRSLGCLLWSFPLEKCCYNPRVMELLTKELGVLHTRTLPGAYVQSSATTTDTVIRNIRKLWLQKGTEFAASAHAIIVSIPVIHGEHPMTEIPEDGNDHTGKTHSNNSLLLSGAFQVPWRALSTKLSGVLHLHTALKGRRRCFHSTWATSSTAVSSLALSSSLHDQKCSQQSSPVRSTPSLKHFSSFNCSNVHRAKRSSQHIRCPCCYSSTLDRTGEDGLSTQQTCLQVLTTAGNKDRKYLQYGTRHAYIILCLIWPCCV